MSTAPTHLGLVFGGVSGEHAVSIRSANTVAAALRRGGGAKPSAGKRWVRADSEAAGSPASEPNTSTLPTAVVSSFAEIDQLLQAASGQAG